MVRYIDDFVLCFQYRADALRTQEALAKRLGRFSLTLEPKKTKLVEFGRFAHRNASGNPVVSGNRYPYRDPNTHGTHLVSREPYCSEVLLLSW